MVSCLLLGPRFNKKDASNVGGAIVLFEDLINRFDESGIRYVVIDTNKANYANIVFAYAWLLISLIINAPKHTHISLHSTRDYMFISPLVLLLGRLFKLHVSLRKFGGEAKNTVLNAGGLKKRYLMAIFSRYDALFLETKYLVDFFKAINPQSFWFPNVRKKTFNADLPRSYKKRFVFISHVIKEKGIDEIINAAEQLDDSYQIDIYGFILNDEYSENDFKGKRANYRGALEASSVLAVLNEYDVLLLPSYKEGYPGIIIEASSLGIPSIATTLPSISEMISHQVSGLLVPMKDADALSEAIQMITTDNYQNLSSQAYEGFDRFNSESVTSDYFQSLGL